MLLLLWARSTSTAHGISRSAACNSIEVSSGTQTRVFVSHAIDRLLKKCLAGAGISATSPVTILLRLAHRTTIMKECLVAQNLSNTKMMCPTHQYDCRQIPPRRYKITTTRYRIWGKRRSSGDVYLWRASGADPACAVSAVNAAAGGEIRL